MKATLLFLWSTAFALPIGNPSEPALYSSGLCNWRCLHLRIGYYGDFVFQRNIEIWNNGERLGDVLLMQLMTNAGTLTLDICDWIDLYGVVGVSKGESLEDISGLNRRDFSPGICWSVGGRATLWECGNFGLGIEGQYFHAEGALNYNMAVASGALTYFDHIPKMEWSEWQGGIAASYSFCNVANICFVPYAGIKAAAAVLEGGLSDYKTKKLWGYAIGMTAIAQETMGITAEARFGDERALFINGQVSF